MPVKYTIKTLSCSWHNVRALSIGMLMMLYTNARAQDSAFNHKGVKDSVEHNGAAKDTSMQEVVDVGDFMRKLFKKKVDPTKPRKVKSVAVLPSIGYNPSFGFVIGAKASAIKQFGNKSNTNLSAFGLEALYTSKGIITAQIRHNIFTKENGFNFVGNWQVSKFMIADYNIGTGNKDYRTDSDSAFLLRFNYVRLTAIIFKRQY